MRRSVTPVRVVAVRPGRHLEIPDRLATEEPMEIRACGPAQPAVPVVVTMRTPGHDFELAAGFLLTEGLVSGLGDLAAVRYCELPPGTEQRYNVVTVELTRAFHDAGAGRRSVVNASCGICGKTSLDEVAVSCPALPAGPRVAATLLPSLPNRLRAAQKLFEQTGGLHAAAVFDINGGLLCLREDVGRHNAVDKVVGNALLAGRLPLSGCIAMVSGRVSFEIVQKAAMAGIAMVAAVSAPSSLAVEAAQRLGMTIAGFVRGDRYNLYCHPERIDLSR